MRLRAKGLTLPAAKPSVKQSISAAVFPIWLPGLSPLRKNDPRNHTKSSEQVRLLIRVFRGSFQLARKLLKTGPLLSDLDLETSLTIEWCRTNVRTAKKGRF